MIYGKISGETSSFVSHFYILQFSLQLLSFHSTAPLFDRAHIRIPSNSSDISCMFRVCQHFLQFSLIHSTPSMQSQII